MRLILILINSNLYNIRQLKIYESDQDCHIGTEMILIYVQE